MFAKLYTVAEEVDFEDEKETSLQIIWIFRVRPFYKITLWKLPEKITFHIDYWDFRKLNLRWLRFFCKIVHCGVVGEEVEDEEEEESQTYILTKVNLLYPLCYEIPCMCFWL